MSELRLQQATMGGIEGLAPMVTDRFLPIRICFGQGFTGRDHLVVSALM